METPIVTLLIHSLTRAGHKHRKCCYTRKHTRKQMPAHSLSTKRQLQAICKCSVNWCKKGNQQLVRLLITSSLWRWNKHKTCKEPRDNSFALMLTHTHTLAVIQMKRQPSRISPIPEINSSLFLFHQLAPTALTPSCLLLPSCCTSGTTNY